MDYSSRDVRVSSMMRSVFIAVLIAIYAWVSNQPAASLTTSFLIAAGLQLGVILLRKFVPPEVLPQALYVFELIADGVSVLMFALGVFGGFLQVATSV